MHFKSITDIILKDKVVLIRVDMNVPIIDGKITDDSRIIANLPTIKFALKNNAKVIIATHLGRPKEGLCSNSDSIKLIALAVGQKLNINIPIISNLEEKVNFTHSDVVILENVRCNIGESKNDVTLGKKYAALCDVFVHDAFATAHRKEASTDAVGYYAKEVCAGLLMQKELEALNHVIKNIKHPFVAVVGGSKVSTKLLVLKNLAKKVDVLIIGGGILNTFLVAAGFSIGKSLYEQELVKEAKEILHLMQLRNAILPLPKSVKVAKEFNKTAIAYDRLISEIQEDDIILDISEDFAYEVAVLLKTSQLIIWNGPMGVFEFNNFAIGTKIVATAIANSTGFTLAGGGDTIAAINTFQLHDKLSYISTAGGALLEFLEGKQLPAIELLSHKKGLN